MVHLSEEKKKKEGVNTWNKVENDWVITHLSADQVKKAINLDEALRCFVAELIQ